MPTPGNKRALLDTSVLVADDVNLSGLVCQVSAVSYAELHFGVQAATSEAVRLARQHRLTLIQATYGHGLAFSDDAAHHYGLLCARLRQFGRSPRGRALDLMIAATALSLGVPLVTRNVGDVVRLGVAVLER
ncbi:PIN domain-containing protein [Mycobacterium riyadhense]|uniref:PIN domain-containing protein n=1 Tax=Mycobacterium riyadhense TaxID=486698 RepID=UPI000A1598EE|nr:PIN domain-containing protein [Mycobacterium riyadhense]MCV7146582.1 PIN domain-containing protein [Mycobacterium riyadhense]